MDGGERLRLWASRWVIGNGDYTFAASIRFGGPVLAGSRVGAFSADHALRRRPGQSRAAGFALLNWRSLENPPPLVRLKPAFAEAEHGATWIESFFHAPKIAGFALAAILVGALALLGG